MSATDNSGLGPAPSDVFSDEEALLLGQNVLAAVERLRIMPGIQAVRGALVVREGVTYDVRVERVVKLNG